MTISSISSQSSDWISQLLETMGRSRNTGGGDDLAQKLMNGLDENGDSSLGLKETGLSQSAFSKADADGDGQVSAQELADALAVERAQMMAGAASGSASSTLLGSLLSQAGVSMPAPGMGHTPPPPPDDEKMADSLISKLDEDGDSALSLKESGLDEEAFNKVDADGDGLLTSQELADALKSEREQMMAGAASNAGSSILKTLLDEAGMAPGDQNAGLNPLQLRKAMQAYGGNILMTAFLGDGSETGLSFEDLLSSGQGSPLGMYGAELLDYTI